MPNTKSAKKRHRQSEERRLRNRAMKSTIKTQIKKVRDAVDKSDVAKAQEELVGVAKKVDLAAARGVLHKNTAARTKSRLASLIKAAKSK